MAKKQPDIQPQPKSKREGPILPDVKVRLTGKDGNAFAVLGTVQDAMKKKGHGDKVDAFLKEAMAGDYDHLLQTCLKWVDAT